MVFLKWCGVSLFLAVILGTLAVSAPAAAEDPSTCQEYLKRGSSFLAQHRPAEALVNFQKAADLEPKNALASCRIADALAKLHRYPPAVKQYGKALVLDPKLVDAYFGRGYVQGIRMRLYDRSIIDLKRAVELDADRVDCWTLLGDVLTFQMRDKESLAAFTRALALDPKVSRTWAKRSSVQGFLQAYSAAIADNKKAIELSPNNQHYHLTLAIVEQLAGRFKDSLKTTAQIIGNSMGARGPYARRRIAYAYALSGKNRYLLANHAAAKKDLLTAISMAPSNSFHRIWLAALTGDVSHLESVLVKDHRIANVAMYLLGKITAERLIKSAKNAKDAVGALCEYHCYIGVIAERKGQAALAETHYKACVKTQKIKFGEYGWAQMRLKALEKK